MSIRIYLAGPLFSTAERDFNAALAQELRKRGYEVFVPQEQEQRQDLPRSIFLGDVGGLDWCDVVVANLDGADPDSGTCWECGYAFGKKRIYAFRTDFRVFNGADKVNLMLTESASEMIYAPNYSVERLARVLDTYLGVPEP